MARVGNLSSDLHRTSIGGGVRSTRIPKEVSGNKPKRHRTGSRSAKTVAEAASTVDAPLIIEKFDSVWDALGFGAAEAANLEVRASLMIELREIIRAARWTQAVAAKACGVSQPRVNDLLKGKIDKFSIDALVKMAGCLGRRVNFKLIAA